MLIEMWAYVSDVLNFYDERIANEEYIRTAVRRPSLRRLVEMLGYVPAPGLAAHVTLAAIAEGRTPVIVPAGTGFRSDAFTDPITGSHQSPQVFEIGVDTTIHPLKNEWPIGPQPDNVSKQATPTEAAQGSTVGIFRKFLVFSPTGLGLAPGKLALITAGGVSSTARVKSVTPFGGKDGKSYVEVGFETSVQIPAKVTDASTISVQIPTVLATVTQNTPTNGESVINGAAVYLDKVYNQLHTGDPVIVTLPPSEGTPSVDPVSAVTLAQVNVPGSTATATVKTTNTTNNVTTTTTTTTLVNGITSVTKVTLTSGFLSGPPPSDFNFAFAFIPAGTVATVGKIELQPSDFSSGVSITGKVQAPPDATAGSNGSFVETQEFLVADVDKHGADFHGSLTIDSAGQATLKASGTSGFPSSLKTPITAFGNLFEATRGESVTNESDTGGAAAAAAAYVLLGL